MKRSKLFLVAIAALVLTTLYANSPARFIDVNAVSHKIEHILKKSSLELEDGFEVTVFFSISDDKRIQQLQVASPHQELNDLIVEELEDQKITGPSWRFGKIYELSVIAAKNHYITSLGDF